MQRQAMRFFRGQIPRQYIPRNQVRRPLGDYGNSDGNAFPQNPQYSEDELFAPPAGSDSLSIAQNPRGINFNLTPQNIANASVQVLPGNLARISLIIQSLSASDLYVNFGQGAEVGTGILLQGLGAGVILDYICPTNSVNLIFNNAAAQRAVVIEGVRG